MSESAFSYCALWTEWSCYRGLRRTQAAELVRSGRSSVLASSFEQLHALFQPRPAHIRLLHGAARFQLDTSHCHRTMEARQPAPNWTGIWPVQPTG